MLCVAATIFAFIVILVCVHASDTNHEIVLTDQMNLNFQGHPYFKKISQSELADFHTFMYKYGRSYKTQDEYIKRFQNFHNSKKFIDNYNANVYKLNSSAWLGIQETSDWGDDELLGQKGDRLMRAAKRPS